MAEYEIEQAAVHPNNFKRGRAGQRAIAICSHVSMGGAQSTLDWFASANAGVCAHFLITKAGKIYQFVNVADMAYANGPVRNPNTAPAPWLKPLVGVDYGANPYTISVEWEGYHVGGEWYTATWGGKSFGVWRAKDGAQWFVPTDEQYQAGVWLYSKLIRENGITLNRAHIIRHSDVDSVVKPYCPGAGFPLARLLADLALRAKPFEFKVLGQNTITAEVFKQVLTDAHSPAIERIPALQYWQEANLRGINPAWALAQFGHESQYGTDGIAKQTLNWGNLRPRSDGSIGRAIGVVGGFRKYASWFDGFLDYLELWRLPLYDGKDVWAILRAYAPTGDGNAPEAYAKAVLGLMDRWRVMSGIA